MYLGTMTKAQFLNIESFISSCKDFDIVYRIYSSIKARSKHYIALCSDWSCKLLECRGKTVLVQEGITIKWRKGKVTFAKQDLQTLSDGRKYYLVCRDEDGITLGESRPFQFCTESDEFRKDATKNIPNLLKTKNLQLQHETVKKEIISEPPIIRKLKSLLEISITLVCTANFLSNSMQDVKKLVDSFTTQLQKALTENIAQGKIACIYYS